MSEDAEAAPVTHGIISVTTDEVTYSATYELKRGLVTVRADIGTRSGPLRNGQPNNVARMLLRELIQLEKLRRDDII